jgi:hypothetical protein
VRRTDRALVAVELAFAVPLTIVGLVLCVQLTPTVWFGIADAANAAGGTWLGLPPHVARWRPEGYWFQDGVLTLAGAACVYPLTARCSVSLLGMVGLAVPLSATGVVVAAHGCSRAWQYGVLALVAFAWLFGAMAAFAVTRERNVVDRRVLVGGVGLVLLAAAILLLEFASSYQAVSAWGSWLLGTLIWGRWVILAGHLARGAQRVA